MFTATYRTLAIHISMLGLLAFAGNTNAFAQPGMPQAAVPPFTLDFDETGASLLNGGPNPNQVVPVAGGGIKFYLPGQVTAGDVLIGAAFDTASPNGDSDVLSFFNGPDQNGTLTGIMLYQSLLEPADPLLPADVQGLVFATPFSALKETGTELANGFTWIVPGATYNGISDGFLRTPEPSTFVLAGLGLLSLAALAYRRRRRSRLCVAGLLLVAISFGSAQMVFAQAPGTPVAGTPGFTFTFDEQGNSLLNGGANPNPVNLISGGGIQYFLPGPVVTGDVLVRGLSDITGFNNGISDLLSFSNNTANQGILTYLSLIDDNDPNPDAADHPNFNTITPFGVTEFGPEGQNGFQWVPDPSNPFGAVYNGISDGVIPEPSTFVLAGLGLLSLAALAYRRRLARTR